MQLAWRKGTLGLFVGVVAILLAINFFNLAALADIASAAFIFSHMAVQVAHWRLIDETKGSRPLVGLALLSMAFVLVVFLWSTAFTEPWSVALFFVFIAGSWSVEAALSTAGPAGLRMYRLPRGRSFSEYVGSRRQMSEKARRTEAPFFKKLRIS